MGEIWKVIKYWGQIFILPIYFMSFLMPRSRKIWVFGSTFGHRFADNPKYFYLYLNKHYSHQIRSIWITRDRQVKKLLSDNGLNAYYLYSVKGIWYSLRAKVYLYDNYSKDISFILSGGAIKVNLWHGVPLKKIQMDNRFDYIRHPRTKREYFNSLLRRISDEKPTDYVLTTSSMLQPIFASAFQTNRIIISGYPRNDCLVSDKLQLLTVNENEQLELIKMHKTQKKIALYMPTFRDSEIKFFDIIDINKFHSFLVKEKIQFLFKLHPKSKLNEQFKNLSGQNFSFIHQSSDPYPLLKYTDFLVTDYSSIYFDYLITDKPIIFFSYDLEEYVSNSRDLYFDYLSFTPGPKVYDQDGLEKALLEVDIFEKERKKIKKMVFNDKDMNCLAGEELFNKLQDIINVGHTPNHQGFYGRDEHNDKI